MLNFTWDQKISKNQTGENFDRFEYNVRIEGCLRILKKNLETLVALKRLENG